MRLKALQYLTAVVDAGSFAKAAVMLEVNASTLTRCIDALEDELGLTLLERSHSGVRLTSGGTAVMVAVRRMLADLDAVAETARYKSAGNEGELKLGVRMPPIGDPLETLLAEWRGHHPKVSLTLYEMPDHDLYTAVENRRLDAALVAGYGAWPNVATEPLFCELLFAALPNGHPLCARESVDWNCLRRETILVQDWDGSHATREFYASLLGIGMPFQSHSASEQSVLALVGAGFGVTLVTHGRALADFPGVTFKPIREPNAQMRIELAWALESKDAVVGRFVSFMRDNTRLKRIP